MIDFSLHRSENRSVFMTVECREMFKHHTDNIYADLSNIKANKFWLGVHLIDLYRSRLFSSWANGTVMIELCEKYGWSSCVGNCSGEVFFAYCEKFFHLDKSQVSRYMNIVDEFGDGLIDFKEEWKDFSYSQLVEMLPLTSEQRKPVLSSWTVKAIREYKKELVAMSQPVDISDNQKPVATSQQNMEKDYNSNAGKDSRFKFEAIEIPLTCDIFDYTKYDKFRGMSLRAVLDRLIKAEEDCKRLMDLSGVDITSDNSDNLPSFNNDKISPF